MLLDKKGNEILEGSVVYTDEGEFYTAFWDKELNMMRLRNERRIRDLKIIYGRDFSLEVKYGE